MEWGKNFISKPLWLTEPVSVYRLDPNTDTGLEGKVVDKIVQGIRCQ